MAVCLVTGGAGFLGSHLVEALVADNHVVRVLDNFTTGKLENLAGVIDPIELYAGDVFDPDFVSKVMRGVELVFHTAWQPEPVASSDRSNRGDASGTLTVLAAALKARVSRLVFASSVKVYDYAGPDPVDESAFAEPQSHYGRAKLSGEQACGVYSRCFGIETVCLRYFNLFGPRQPVNSPYASAVNATLEAIAAGRSPVLDGEEHTSQDLLYVEDAVHATLLAARSPRVAGKVYNIARGQRATYGEIIDTFSGLLSSRIDVRYGATRPRTAVDNLACTRRAEVELGFCPGTDLRRGLSRCLEAIPRALEVCPTCVR
jgi:UDP-glucose 4-epimerase